MEELLVLLGSEVAPLVNSIIVTLIGVIFAFLGVQARSLMKRVENHERIKQIKDSLENNKELVKIAVDYAEQIGNHLKGEAKFDLARTKALELFADKGINISEQELEALIEQMVFGFKQGYNEELDRELEESQGFSEEIVDGAGVKLFKGEKIDGYDSDIH